MKINPNAPCPCKSGKKFKRCCRLYHRGQKPPTPEVLMRSRYTAYAIGEIAYIINTTHPDSPHYQPNQAVWQSQVATFSNQTRFIKLEILNTELDQANQQGWVTFHATLIQNKKDASFTERSLFKQVEGRWLYVKAEKI